MRILSWNLVLTLILTSSMTLGNSLNLLAPWIQKYIQFCFYKIKKSSQVLFCFLINNCFGQNWSFGSIIVLNFLLTLFLLCQKYDKWTNAPYNTLVTLKFWQNRSFKSLFYIFLGPSSNTYSPQEFITSVILLLNVFLTNPMIQLICLYS